MFLLPADDQHCSSTFGQRDRPEVVDVHDRFVHLQGEILHRRFDLHAAVADQHVHTAVALGDLCDRVRQVLHITEVQQHQLGCERLRQEEV